MKRIAIAAAALAALILSGCSANPAPAVQSAVPEGAAVITLSGSSAELDGAPVAEYDYVWHADPSSVHEDVKDSPAEYYTGTVPEGSVYIAHDIIYYPELDAGGFVRETYDGETEWVYRYTADGYTDWRFSTLPVQGDVLPAEMMHTEAEAYSNPVLHINAGGTYVLRGTWNGQIAVDAGGDASVTFILDGVSVVCTAAPAFIVYSARECCTADVTGSHEPDTSDAGVRIVISDGSVNDFSGSNVFRILKTKYKDDGDTQKKSHKYDGAFYSCVTMEIDGGDGVLNIESSFEGLDSELHLTVNGGRINIRSANDGVNVNEDGVSVFTLNGGEMSVLSGLGAEGDGIDSNGYIVINGGTLYAIANPASDEGLDSENGTFINGGTVVQLGSDMGGSAYSVYVDGELQYGAAGGGPGFRPGGMPDMPGGEAPGGMTPPDMQPGGMTPPQGGFNSDGGAPGQRSEP